MSKSSAATAPPDAAAPAQTAPDNTAAPAPDAAPAWPERDEYTGIGGTYVRDPVTGRRTPLESD
jgi:hypothetical protein